MTMALRGATSISPSLQTAQACAVGGAAVHGEGFAEEHDPSGGAQLAAAGNRMALVSGPEAAYCSALSYQRRRRVVEQQRLRQRRGGPSKALREAQTAAGFALAVAACRAVLTLHETQAC